MNSIYSQFQTDPELEKKGIELVYAVGAGVAIILQVARAGGANARYQKVLEHKTKPYRRQIQTETIAPEQLDMIMRDVYSDTVVLGWWTAENFGTPEEKRRPTVDDAAGKPMDFNKENVVKLFTDLGDMFTDVQQQAQKVALFRRQVLEDDAKNS